MTLLKVTFLPCISNLISSVLERYYSLDSTSHRGMDDDILSLVKTIVPPLMSKKHKGQDGRIGIIGGCQEYVVKDRQNLLSCIFNDTKLYSSSSYKGILELHTLLPSLH